jgi:hypothetical protein
MSCCHRCSVGLHGEQCSAFWRTPTPQGRSGLDGQHYRSLKPPYSNGYVYKGCVCVYICSHAHVCLCVCLWICVHTDIVHVCICAYVFVCVMSTRVHRCTCVHRCLCFMCICVHMPVYTCARVRACIYTCMHMGFCVWDVCICTRA